MYIDKYKKNQKAFVDILKYVLNKQPETFNLKSLSFKEIEDECWCKVTYTNSKGLENHFWVNDYRAYSKDLSINISALNRDYTRQIYLHNAKNLNHYVYNFFATKTLDTPEFLVDYRTAPKVTNNQNDPFYGITPEQINKKAIFHNYISQFSSIDENAVLKYLKANHAFAAKILTELSSEYKIPCTQKQAIDKIEQTILSIEQRQLNNEIQHLLHRKVTNNQKAFEDAKRIIYFEQQIEDYETNLMQLQNVYNSTGKLNTGSLRLKIQHYSMDNNQLMQNDFYRTVLENILVLEKIKNDTQNFSSNIDYDEYWSNLTKSTVQALDLKKRGADYNYDVYSLASLMANRFGLEASKYRPILYNELLVEQDKILRTTENSPEQIEYNLDLNYRILAEELKKSNPDKNSRAALYADAYIRYGKLTQPEINEQYEKELSTLKNQISILKTIKSDKIKECKKASLELKDLLIKKSEIDKKIDKIKPFEEFYGIDELVKLDFENIDANKLSNEVLTVSSKDYQKERSA